MTTTKKKINSRAKGQRAERELVKKFSKFWGSDFARTPLSGGMATLGKKYNVDVSGDVVTDDPSWPFSVECKHHDSSWNLESLFNPKNPIEKWWGQCCKAADSAGKRPLLVFKKNRGPFYAMLVTDKDLDFPNFEFTKCASIMSSYQPKKIMLLDDFLSTPKAMWL